MSKAIEDGVVDGDYINLWPGQVWLIRGRRAHVVVGLSNRNTRVTVRYEDGENATESVAATEWIEWLLQGDLEYVCKAGAPQNQVWEVG